MTMSSFLQIFYSVVSFAFLFVLFLLLRNLPSGSRNRIVRRMQSLTERRGDVTTTRNDGLQDDILTHGTLWQKAIYRLQLLGEKLPLLDAKQRSELGGQLTRAGFRGAKAVSILIGIKLVVGAVCALFAAIIASSIPVVAEHFLLRVVMMGATFILGVILPEMVLGFMVSRRQKIISCYFSDALDLLIICTNAGNSLPVSIKRVAREMEYMCAPLSDELAYTADQLQVDGDTAGALKRMAERIGGPSIRSLVTTLIQSQQYGTPIAQSLKTLSRSERNAQMMQLEEKAAKLAPKLTVPMMLFILPTVILVSAGPAVLNLMAMFSTY
jgi:tight adherence protein C